MSGEHYVPKQQFSPEEEHRIVSLIEEYIASGELDTRVNRVSRRDQIEIELISEGWDAERASLMAAEARSRWAAIEMHPYPENEDPIFGGFYG